MYLFLCPFILRLLAGRDCLTSFRNAKQRRCRSGAWHPASPFWGNKRSFVATKVQLAWKILQRRAMLSRVLFCAKITVERGFRTKCTTLFFKERINLTGVSRTFGCRVCQTEFFSVYVHDVFRLYGISEYEMKSGLVSDGLLCRLIHPLIVRNIIHLSDNKREKEYTDI